MKKKFTCLVLCLLVFCLSVLTGCSLVGVNNDKYYNAVIVEIKDKNGKVVTEITNREVLTSYQNVGYYYEYQGYTKAQAVDLSLKLLENRKLTILKAEEEWGIDKTGKNLQPLEKTYLWEQTASALQANLDSYLKSENTESSEDEGNAIKYEAYAPKAYLDPETFEIKLIDAEDGVLDNYTPSVSNKDYSVAEDRALIYDNFFENNKYGENFSAYKKYLTQIRESDKYLGLSLDAKDVFEREIERLYVNAYENYVVSRYTEQLLENNGVSSIEVQDILDLYSSKVRQSYTQYSLEGDSSYSTTMGEKASDVYYYLEGKQNVQYFTVLNILFNKNASEEGKYDLIIRENDGEGNYKEESEVVVTKSEIEGFIVNNITNPIINAQSLSNDEYLYNKITDCVFMYNQDPGMQKADASYVIGVDGQGKAVSNFVESFNNAGLSLYNDGKGQLGDIEIAESEYGIHVLIYTGAYQNMFEGIDENFYLQNEVSEEGKLSAIEILDRTRITPMLDKSYFDVLFDELYVDSSSQIQAAHTEVLRSNYIMVYHKGRLPEALKG